MKTKARYIFLILVIVSFTLLYYNHNNVLTEISFDTTELRTAKILFLVGILLIGLWLFIKKWRNLLTKILIVAFGICIVLNLFLIAETYKIQKIQNTIAEYYALKTCGKMENRFTTDLKNDEIKYFQFGIGTDLELQRYLKTNYGIESYGMGCMVQPEFDCYNELVNNYLKEKHNDGIIDY
tara:strand:- start:753 stop:1295 length:543 start_codon:yes stop_codon:yes gene_type:complete